MIIGYLSVDWTMLVHPWKACFMPSRNSRQALGFLQGETGAGVLIWERFPIWDGEW